jgi:transcriptional regulator with XRE-family HTH domain
MLIRIKELRLERKMKQAELAKIIGVSQNTLSYWERGEYKPDNAALQKLADFFLVSIDYLLGRTNVRREGEIAAAHLNNGMSYDDLPPEALQQLEEYRQFLIQKYGKKKQ